MQPSPDPSETLNAFYFWAVGKSDAERSLRFNDLVIADDEFRRFVERKGMLNGCQWQEPTSLSPPSSGDELYE